MPNWLADRICGELYGARDAVGFVEVMNRAKVCRRPAKYRITIPDFGSLKRCGTHARAYRNGQNTVVLLDGVA